MGKNILVLGGLGFLGRSLVDHYRMKGYSVHVTSKYFDLKPTQKLFTSDYSKESLLEILNKERYENIFFLSGNPYPALSVNDCTIDVNQTLIPLINICEAIKEVRFEGTLWFASSVAVYGETNLPIQRESDVCRPLSNYALIKLAGENYLKMVSRTENMNVGSLRIFSTFGGGLKRQLVYDIFKKIQENDKKISLLGSGLEVRDLSYVLDQAKRIKLISDNIIPKGDIVNVGSGEPSTTKQIAEFMIKIMNKKTEILFSQKKRSFDGSSWIASMEKLEKIANNPKTPLNEALYKTIRILEKS